jgi:hypothetical protein
MLNILFHVIDIDDLFKFNFNIKITPIGFINVQSDLITAIHINIFDNTIIYFSIPHPL